MSQYMHPEFGFFCPTPRLRRWLRVALAVIAVPAIGLAVMATGRDADTDSALAVAAVDAGYGAEISPAVSFTPVAVVPARSAATTGGGQTAAEKPACVGDAYADGKCVAEKPRKPRMVRVPGNRPAIASIPLGRTAAPLMGATENSTPAAAAPNGRQGETSKTAQATTTDAAAAGSTEQARKPATKKKTAHSQNRRRDQYGYGGWREVRVDDWSRGYGQRDYSRGGYGQGYRSFW